MRMSAWVRRFVLFVALAAAASIFAAPVDAVTPADAIVSQGGVTVTVGDVDAYMQKIPTDKWAGFINNAGRIESILKDLLRTKQMAKQARDMNLDQSQLAQDQLALARDEVLAKLRFDAFAKSIKVPDLSQLAKEEYLAHKDKYVVPADVTVQHLLVSTDGRTDDDAKTLASKLRDEAAADPAKFGELVKQYSDDPSKSSNDGIMKDATSSKYVPEFAKAAALLGAKNPISPIVKTRFGYHILRYVDSTSAKQQTFDEVKAQILDSLDQQYVADQKKNFLNQLAGQEMTPYPDAIASLHDRYFTSSGVPVENPPESAGAKSLIPKPESQ